MSRKREPSSPWECVEPIREDLFNVERIEEHARQLARTHTVTAKLVKGRPLTARVADNAAVLLASHQVIALAIDRGRAITPAAEWLLDNYYLVERQIDEIHTDLPSAYYRQLPKLAAGALAGYPRVLAVAWAFIAHTDSRFDAEMLCRYLVAYQEVQPLTIGELWALAITLRLLLIENLRRIAESIVRNHEARRTADLLADRLLGINGLAAMPSSALLAAYEQAPLREIFAVELVYRLRDQDPRVTPALTWLDERLVRQGTTLDAVVRDEHQRQGASSITVRNIINSMRLIADVDWTELVERVSLVDKVLAAGGVFAVMDFPTRNLYRSAIETLARGSHLSEIAIARRAVGAAEGINRPAVPAPDSREGDPGYYLLGDGRPVLEKMIGYRLSWRAWPTRLNRSLGIVGYAFSIILAATACLALPLFMLAAAGLGTLWLLTFGLLGAIPALDAAVALVSRAATSFFGAAQLPALDLEKGIPPHLRTIIAVPTLLTTMVALKGQIESLAIHHLASPGGDLHFALLSDWIDADTEQTDGDQTLLDAAKEGIQSLNQRFAPALGGDRFLLLHRRRVWNQSERKWMGWERKRGKLHELNRLLRGATDTTFLAPNGHPPPVPKDVRYVVTLDSDTRLPRDTVHRLIGKMAHPLNRPVFDSAVGRVVAGYAVMQPRVTPSLPTGREGSLFQRTFSSMNGIDPYAAARSDLYQDLFGQGSYTGKGIYDIDAFELALRGRVADSTMLSHDLFEGIFAGAGLASDIEVVEEYPARYDVDAQRHHRWARGDWQLLPWILADLSLPAIGRWKMIDNLRRTLSAPMAVLALLVGWVMPLPQSAAWTLFILATILLPTALPVFAAIVPRHQGITSDSHLRALRGDIALAATQYFLRLSFLADQAWLMSDAIGRTLIRLFVTRRHLLEWTTAAQASIGPRRDLLDMFRRMAAAFLIGVGGLAVAVVAGDGTWSLALPLAALWVSSPAIAWWVSQSPADAGRLSLCAADARALRLIARRTWRFFESFVTPSDHMLPPDNFQEDPYPVIAHRTSPTNIGLYLLSAASAHDFGWIGVKDVMTRLEATFASMNRLERFRGHYYNWYDTQDLRPLDPIYISAVDSGNLAGHLLALANSCVAWRQLALTAERRLEGIADALDLAREEVLRLDDGRRTQTVTWRQLEDALAALTAGAARTLQPGEDITERLASLGASADTIADIAQTLAAERNDTASADMLFWVTAARQSIASHRRDLETDNDSVPAIAARLAALECASRQMAMAMEFGFLFDHDRKLLAIGYRVPESSFDPNCYDLLASEARLASFLAIAKGDIPSRHWFRLGRPVTSIGNGAALVSWSGSMFEYLMPSLVMRAPAGSLIEETSRLIVRRQREYGLSLGVPWGISESAYNARDLELTYQYSNFGVPGLGLKRGLRDNVVVAPYATALASMVDPAAACSNFKQLADLGALGRHGFYEALDYTPGRVPDGKTLVIVRAYMAHHQGMTIVAIADALGEGVMRTRFHAEPLIQATELLLQERTPRDVAVVRPLSAEGKSGTTVLTVESSSGRHIETPHSPTPATHLLSNGDYAVMLTAAGSGSSRWRDLAVTRWREDATCDDWGSYIFLRDTGDGKVWSAGFQPCGVEPDSYDVLFKEDSAEFTRRDGIFTTTLEILVSTEHAAEVRRLTVLNGSHRSHEIDVTSYAELVLAPPSADLAHPAFSKLFVETEFLADKGILLATRRRRSPDEAEIWVAHLAVIDGEQVGEPEIETDRARLLGRGGTVRRPIAILDGRKLSNSVGTVLDPIFALRHRVRIAPGACARLAFWTMVGASRSEVLDLADKHRDIAAFERATTLAWTQAQVQLHHVGIEPGTASLFQRLAGHLIYAAPTLRPSSEVIRQGGGGKPGLWMLGISGDLPIIVLRIADSMHVPVVRQVLRANEYWRMKQLAVDVVILNERASSYVQDLQIELESLARTSQARSPARRQHGPSGRVFVFRTDQIAAESRALLLSVARVVLLAQRGRLADQLDRVNETGTMPHPFARRPSGGALAVSRPTLPVLEFFNGLGGFAEDGREYVTVLGPGQSTPAPWINVIANPAFGFHVAAEGSGFSWSTNSRENQVTPWSNDPVGDRSGEGFYLTDLDSRTVWGPTASPMRDDNATYIARHGRGYSRFELSAHGIESQMVQFVPLDDPIKITRLVLHNRSGRVRHLSLTAYVEWVLGPSRTAAAAFLTTEIDTVTGAMLATNPWNSDFSNRVAFIDLAGQQTSWTGDRREFIGRNGSLAVPSALANGAQLSNLVGAGIDPCGALRCPVDLAVDGRVEIVILLGEAIGVAAARTLIARYREADLDDVQAAVGRYWDMILGQVQVTSPDRAMDIMLNGWLLYQTLACRIWARSAFYQASGAYGFRDQLQDGMALTAASPLITRDHLLCAAARQFVEGDVQHWWLPHSGLGVRTRISDDLIWLPFAVAHYIDRVDDRAILDETITFLEGQALAPGEHDILYLPTVTDESASLFEHCARALDHSLALGVHGLPLFGTGDWNDGMNRVGALGKGESVWLGWFLTATLEAFIPLAEARQEITRARAWQVHAAGLRASLEREAWDGDWYRRGWFDDGTPLGSADSQECRIDSIAQSWAVLSGAAPPERAHRAMAAVERDLIRAEDGLALLFAPPFDHSAQDPGYIKGYPPGIRENGGQYTHAALWSVMAFAALGEGDKATGLFSLLNPINHARTRASLHRYKVEPYVIAADVYAMPPHVGRGGWTWYTGSAGWMQRAGIESIFGVRLAGNILHFDPCIARAWNGFALSLRHGSAQYQITVDNPVGVERGVTFASLDDRPLTQRPLQLSLDDDGAIHRLVVRLG